MHLRHCHVLHRGCFKACGTLSVVLAVHDIRRPGCLRGGSCILNTATCLRCWRSWRLFTFTGPSPLITFITLGCITLRRSKRFVTVLPHVRLAQSITGQMLLHRKDIKCFPYKRVLVITVTWVMFGPKLNCYSLPKARMFCRIVLVTAVSLPWS